MATRPEKSFRCGGCETAIFGNEISKNGRTATIKKVVFQKRYKSADGEWKTTHSLDVNEIPKAILVLFKAYEHLCSGNSSDNSNDDSEQ